MTADEALYDVREQTGNPAHASVNDVVDLVLMRAENPRTDHQDAHFGEAMAAAVDRYGTGTVRTVIHRVLVEHYPIRPGSSMTTSPRQTMKPHRQRRPPTADRRRQARTHDGNEPVRRSGIALHTSAPSAEEYVN